MHAREVDRLLSRSLMMGWAIPCVLLLLPLFTFAVMDRFWLTVAVLSVVAAVLLCRVAEVPSNYARREPPAPLLPPARQCRRAVYLFSLLTVVGSALILFDQQGALGAIDVANLQQRYVDIMLAAREGDRLGTGLSTIGNILRAFVYVAIVAMVALSRQSPGFGRTAIPWLSLLVAIAFSEIATASRTYVVFCVIVGLIAGFVVRHRAIQRLGTLLMLGFVAVIMFSVTTNQRLEATGADLDIAMDFFTDFFGVHLGWLGQWIADYLGFPVVAGLLYLAHPLPEFSQLVADGSSQVALGGHSLYLVIAPLERLVGIEPAVAANALAQRQGMWWGMLGDLYLDFGVAFVVAYPLLLVLMTRATHALRTPDVFSLTVRSMTGAMFFASPFFGVLNTYSFTYLLLLGLAALNLSMRRKSRLPSASQTIQPA